MALRDSQVVVAAFDEDEAQRLTGVSLTQIRYWHRTGFFVPSLANVREGSIAGNLYSFRDLVSLQVLHKLRNEAKVSLQHLREVKAQLISLGEDLWAKSTIYVLDKKVVIQDSISGDLEEVLSKQKVFKIPLLLARANMRKAVEDSRKRNPELIGQVGRQKGVSNSKPVIAGTAVRVSAIQAFHDAGYSVEKILSEYPTLSLQDIEAAIAYSSAA